MPSFQEKSPLKSEKLLQSTVYQDFYYPSIISSIGTKNPNPSPNREEVRISCVWWGKVDSNHRSYKQQIYSLSPLATREFPHMKLTPCKGLG